MDLRHRGRGLAGAHEREQSGAAHRGVELEQEARELHRPLGVDVVVRAVEPGDASPWERLERGLDLLAFVDGATVVGAVVAGGRENDRDCRSADSARRVVLPEPTQDGHVPVSRQPRRDGPVSPHLHVGEGTGDAGLGPVGVHRAHASLDEVAGVPMSLGGASAAAQDSQSGNSAARSIVPPSTPIERPTSRRRRARLPR